MEKLYLKVTAWGVAGVALLYFLMPTTAAGNLLTLSYDNIDQLHIMRAVPGLYLGMVAFWFLAASKPEYTRAGLLTATLFMFGLASGRIVSLILDGMPSPFLTGAIVVELISGAWGIALLRGYDDQVVAG